MASDCMGLILWDLTNAFVICKKIKRTREYIAIGKKYRFANTLTA